MSNLTKKINQKLLQWHYWLGGLFAILFVYLATTGVLINHSRDLSLDVEKVSWRGLNSLYGIQTASIETGFALEQQWATQIGESLYLDSNPVAECKSTLVGAVYREELVYLLCQQTLLILLPSGELVERIGDFPEPFQAMAAGTTELYAMGSTNQSVYRLNEDEGLWENAALLPNDLAMVEPQTLPPHLKQWLAQQPPAYAPTWERVLLDAHSGRLLGSLGVLIVDLTAIILLFSSLSGLWMWYRKRLKQRQAQRKRSL